ncbi:MAG: hypothetical protein ABJH68_21130 [Ilumatobacter sp.]|uniref:hypothetical protein n=1 Tax=Ilumatobacter sp. TaxID=1967498 RepID=UPI00329835B2
MADALVLVGALGATWAMTGVIWVIQLVHYPIFDAVDRGTDDDLWRRFGDRHRRAISLVVGPFMLVEGVTGIWLVADPPGSMSVFPPLVAALLMALAYGTTALVSVPLHERLTASFDADAHRRLCSTNWIRTGAWTARAVVIAVIAVVAFT